MTECKALLLLCIKDDNLSHNLSRPIPPYLCLAPYSLNKPQSSNCYILCLVDFTWVDELLWNLSLYLTLQRASSVHSSLHDVLVIGDGIENRILWKSVHCVLVRLHNNFHLNRTHTFAYQVFQRYLRVLQVAVLHLCAVFWLSLVQALSYVSLEIQTVIIDVSYSVSWSCKLASIFFENPLVIINFR
jgi:hypothetical protein